MEGDKPTSLAPAIIAASPHPFFATWRRDASSTRACSSRYSTTLGLSLWWLRAPRASSAADEDDVVLESVKLGASLLTCWLGPDWGFTVEVENREEQVIWRRLGSNRVRPLLTLIDVTPCESRRFAAVLYILFVLCSIICFTEVKWRHRQFGIFFLLEKSKQVSGFHVAVVMCFHVSLRLPPRLRLVCWPSFKASSIRSIIDHFKH